MAVIKSKTVQVNTAAATVYTFLSDLNNLQGLMPSEKIQNWESTSETCSFTIKGLSGIGMKKAEGTENKKVHIVSHGKNPFDFTLDVELNDQGETCEAQVVFDGNMNFMIQTMASGPLTNLFNMMGNELQKRFA